MLFSLVCGPVCAQSTVVGSVDNAYIDGRWSTNIGLAYEIVQSDREFVWGVVGRPPEGDGRVDGLQVEVRSVVGGQVVGAAGVVILDAHGRAVEIRMSNGVVFSRTLPHIAVIVRDALVTGPAGGGEYEDGTRSTDRGAESGVLRIDGRWSSNIDLPYDIVQANNRFSWGVAEREPEGMGWIDGALVHVSWRSGDTELSATGAISLDAYGRPVRIEMSNGIVFWRTLPLLVEIAPGSIVIDRSARPDEDGLGDPASPDVIPIVIP